MQPHSFSKRRLSAIALMLGEEERNSALSDKNEVYVGSQVFQKQKIRRGIRDSVQSTANVRSNLKKVTN
jgi:hypothetical protein